METAPSAPGSTDTLGPETEAERQDRLAWEAEGIAEARSDVAAGRLVDAAKVRAWVDSLRTDNTGRDDTAGGVRVLRVYGPGQDRGGFGSGAG